MKTAIENLSQVYKEKLTQAQFNKISAFINIETGIKLPQEKKIMLQSRLYKRLKCLNIKSFNDYIDYTFSKEGSSSEIKNMIDVVCTNKTSFFREPHHFDFITNEILPEFLHNLNITRNIKIWSAGCSSGEEAYTIAMVLHSTLVNHKNLDYSILGTDISTQILQSAIHAIYPEEKTNEMWI